MIFLFPLWLVKFSFVFCCGSKAVQLIARRHRNSLNCSFKNYSTYSFSKEPLNNEAEKYSSPHKAFEHVVWKAHIKNYSKTGAIIGSFKIVFMH